MTKNPKIPVYEIEGDYYCKVDDITAVKAQKLEKSFSSKNEAIKIFQDYRLFIHVTEMIDELKTPLLLQQIREVYPYLMEGDKLYSQQLFRCSANSYLLHTLSNGFYQVKAIHKDQDNSIKITQIIDSRYPGAEVWSLYRVKEVVAIEDFMHQSKRSDYYDVEVEKDLYSATTAITKENTKNLYVELEDAQLYLAPFLNKEDYIFSNKKDKVYLPIKEAIQHIKKEIGLDIPLGEVIRIRNIDFYLSSYDLRSLNYRYLSVSPFWLENFICKKMRGITNITREIAVSRLICSRINIGDGHFHIVKSSPDTDKTILVKRLASDEYTLKITTIRLLRKFAKNPPDNILKNNFRGDKEKAIEYFSNLYNIISNLSFFEYVVLDKNMIDIEGDYAHTGPYSALFPIDKVQIKLEDLPKLTDKLKNVINTSSQDTQQGQPKELDHLEYKPPQDNNRKIHIRQLRDIGYDTKNKALFYELCEKVAEDNYLTEDLLMTIEPTRQLDRQSLKRQREKVLKYMKKR